MTGPLPAFNALFVLILLRQCLGAPTSTSMLHTGEPFATTATETTIPSSTATARDQSTDSRTVMGERSPVLSIITIVLICAVLVALIMGRLAYVKRYYNLSLRSFFVPPNGIHLCGLINIRGPVAIKTPDGPPTYRGSGYTSSTPRPRRYTRGRQVQGPDVYDNGARPGQRDQDDDWNDQLDVATTPNHQQQDLEKDALPGYSVDLDLPGYNWCRRNQIQHIEHVDSLTLTNETNLNISDESTTTNQVLSDQQYEAQIRRRNEQHVPVQEMEMHETSVGTLASMTGRNIPEGHEQSNHGLPRTRSSDDIGQQRLP
ncbi:hypothetical protein OIO90_004985 [Microbotryomycetes sp. JL221]|nr:hypothetical protein OIO90_004985 [Microbotryomycetes sp. JL221]